MANASLSYRICESSHLAMRACVNAMCESCDVRVKRYEPEKDANVGNCWPCFAKQVCNFYFKSSDVQSGKMTTDW